MKFQILSSLIAIALNTSAHATDVKMDIYLTGTVRGSTAQSDSEVKAKVFEASKSNCESHHGLIGSTPQFSTWCKEGYMGKCETNYSVLCSVYGHDVSSSFVAKRIHPSSEKDLIAKAVFEVVRQVEGKCGTGYIAHRPTLVEGQNLNWKEVCHRTEKRDWTCTLDAQVTCVRNY